MITSTLDPISMQDVTNLEKAPYVIEGDGDYALKIYFESEQNKQTYMEMSPHGAENSPGLKKNL